MSIEAHLVAEEIGGGDHQHAYRQRRGLQTVVTLQPGASWPESDGRAGNLSPFRWVGIENRGVANSGNDVWATWRPYDPKGKADLLVPADAVLCHNAAGEDDPALTELHLTNVGSVAVDVLLVLDMRPVVLQRQPLHPAPGGGAEGAYAVPYSGAAGVVNVAAGQRVLNIVAHTSAAGSTVTVGANPAVTIPAGTSVTLSPLGALTGPVTITFTGTDSYFVEVVQ